MTTGSTQAPTVALIVLTWNQRDLTLDCLASLSALDYPADRREFVVVDNGSVDGTAEAVRATYPGVTVLETGENLGYAGGNNVGIRYALEQGADYVCLLNNDTEVVPDFLTRLVEEAESDGSIGIVGPKMYFFEPSDMVFAAGSLVEWDKGTLNQRGIWQRESIVGPIHSDHPEDVDFIIGCGLLVRRAVLERAGLLDARYYLNYEDVDLCIRANQTGYRVRYTPRAVLYHKVSASLGQASPRNTYYMTRNALLFFSTHQTGLRRLRTLGRVVWRNLGHIAVWTLKPRYRRTARNRRDATILALRDAFLRRLGQAGPALEAICQRK